MGDIGNFTLPSRNHVLNVGVDKNDLNKNEITGSYLLHLLVVLGPKITPCSQRQRLVLTQMFKCFEDQIKVLKTFT